MTHDKNQATKSCRAAPAGERGPLFGACPGLFKTKKLEVMQTKSPSALHLPGYGLDYANGTLFVQPNVRSDAVAALVRGGPVNAPAREILPSYGVPIIGGHSFSVPLHVAHPAMRGSSELDCLHYCQLGVPEVGGRPRGLRHPRAECAWGPDTGEEAKNAAPAALLVGVAPRPHAPPHPLAPRVQLVVNELIRAFKAGVAGVRRQPAAPLGQRLACTEAPSWL
jgi:hypothetical protein